MILSTLKRFMKITKESNCDMVRLAAGAYLLHGDILSNIKRDPEANDTEHEKAFFLLVNEIQEGIISGDINEQTRIH